MQGKLPETLRRLPTAKPVLAETILGAVKLEDNAALKRGRELEGCVKAGVGKLYHVAFRRTGLI